MTVNYVRSKQMSLKNHPTLNEHWIQGLIADDPSILGLGDLVLRDRERIQPRAGRLDLLLQDPDTLRRYEVEIQLGATDESHIIRTIEYYDIEKKRYPQYEHCAVLIAEDITSRFLNVISLFNGVLPLIAIQMQVLSVSDYTTVVFTRVLDELIRGIVDEDEDALAAPTDRAYWEQRASTATVKLADKMLKLLHSFDPALNLNYNKFYIGIEKSGQSFNFVVFRPRKNHINFEVKLPQTDEIDATIDEAGLDTLEYSKRYGLYRIRLTKDDIEKKEDVLSSLSKRAYDRRINS